MKLMYLIGTKVNEGWLEWSLLNVSWDNECHHSQTNMNISYTSAVSDRCAQQNSAVMVLLVPFVTLIVGTIRVLEQITLGDKKSNAPNSQSEFPNFGSWLLWAQPWCKLLRRGRRFTGSSSCVDIPQATKNWLGSICISIPQVTKNWLGSICISCIKRAQRS